MTAETCTCASDGSAVRCPVHTQADFDAADAADDAGVAPGQAAVAAVHVMRWTYDDGCTTAEAVCFAAEGADCRLTSAGPECDCEWWGRIERRDDGTIWHLLSDGYRDLTQPRKQEQWHQVVPQDECNVCLFINESGCAEELTPEQDQHTEFVLADVPFEPVWENDGCSWRPLPAAALAANLPVDDGARAALAEVTRRIEHKHAAEIVREVTATLPRADNLAADRDGAK